nr:helix-turn-helix transcriptional regulator [Brevibacillus fulvus]
MVNARIKANLTQQEVADIAQISRAYYAQVESGSRKPSPDVAKKIAETLKFEWTYFFV